MATADDSNATTAGSGRTHAGGLATVLVTCLFVLGAMLLALDGIVGLGAGDSAGAFTGTWVLVGTAHDDDQVKHDLNGGRLELRDDGTATYAGRDATSLLAPNAASVATWSADASGVGTLRMGANAYLMTLDGGRLVLEADDGALVFVRDGA